MDKNRYLTEKLRISEEQRIAVNKTTVGQQDSWQMIRKGRLTTSNFGNVLNCKRVTPSLLKRVLGQYDLSRVQAINWGIINENQAKKMFEQKTKLPVEESGIWLELSGMPADSPDGLVGTYALLEVKCPFTQRDLTIEEAVSLGKFKINLRRIHKGTMNSIKDMFTSIKYRQLYLTRMKICFFVVWTTKEILILQIKKDPAWADNLQLLKDLYIKHNIPAFSNDLL